MQNGVCKTYHEALELLCKEDVVPFFQKEFGIWRNFREEKLWTIEIDDIFRTNKNEIKELWERYTSQSSKKKEFIIKHDAGAYDILIMEDVLKMVCDDARIAVNSSDVKLAFGLSKQTLIADSEERG